MATRVTPKTPVQRPPRSQPVQETDEAQEPLDPPEEDEPVEAEDETVEEDGDSDAESGEDSDSEDEGDEDADEGEDDAQDDVQESAKPEMHEPPVGQKSQVVPDPVVIKAPEKVEPQTEDPDAHKLSDCYLDSPQPFGFHISGELHQFKKGKTRLTNKQKKACLSHRYVRDNGAQVYRMVKPVK